METLERLIRLAEDELTEYSTIARKVEKLRRKISLSVSPAEQERLQEALLADFPQDWLSRLMANQRQAVALPFWGIAGLGLLLGISFNQPLDFGATAAGAAIAILIQQRGWQLQARQLLLRTLQDMEKRRRDVQ